MNPEIRGPQNKGKESKSVFDKEIGGFSNGLVRVCDWFYFTFGIPSVRESVGTQVVSMRGCISCMI